MREKSRILFLTMLLIMLAARPVEAARHARAVQGAIGAKSAISLDMNTGRILYEQNPDQQIPPASLTKILTLYLAFEAMQEHRLSLTDTVLVSPIAAAEGGSRMNIRPGERVIVREIMKGIAVASGNDACVALAQHLTGTGDIGPFVAAMNSKARELGMTETVFKNPNGLPAEGQLTSARDMLRLSTSYLRRFPQALTFHSMTTYVHNNHNHHNANRLLTSYDGVDGLKTGFVQASGYNNVVTAKRGETRVIAVVLGARSAAARAYATARLLDMSFQRVREGQYVAMLEEQKGRGALPAVLAQAAPREFVREPVREPGRDAREIAREAVREVEAARNIQTPPAAVAQTAEEVRPAASANPMPLLHRRGRAAYAIQESSFQSRHKAERRAQHLEKRGLPVQVVAAKLDGRGKFYRVLVGPYASMDAAKKTREKLLGGTSVE